MVLKILIKECLAEVLENKEVDDGRKNLLHNFLVDGFALYY